LATHTFQLNFFQEWGYPFVIEVRIDKPYFYGKDAPVKKIIERTKRLQALLGDVAETVANITQFIQRERKITATT